MIKKNQRILLLTAAVIFLANLASAQNYTKKYLTHKVIVNYDDHTVIAHVKPVRSLGTESDRQYYWFATDRINMTQGGYSGKLLNGTYQDFYQNKNLKEEGTFDAGLKDGKWKTWNEAGLLKEEYYWSLGKRNGSYSKYDSLGRLAETGRYRNNLLSGKQKTYTANEVKVTFYKKGKVTEKKPLMPGFIRNIFSKKEKVK